MRRYLISFPRDAMDSIPEAAKIAAACRCTQEVREFGHDPHASDRVRAHRGLDQRSRMTPEAGRRSVQQAEVARDRQEREPGGFVGRPRGRVAGVAAGLADWFAFQSGCRRRKMSSPKTSRTEANTGAHARKENSTTVSRSPARNSRISIAFVMAQNASRR